MKPSCLARAGSVLILLALAAGLSGCASTSLKGTPFYTGEYEKRVGPAEDRVNLWPLLYYRNPALSVLWPVFELTEDHAAVRPLFSVYRRQEERKEYNILWPLAQFDRHLANNRIFPVYWGDDYAAVFPLYWHIDTPFADKADGVDALFPLWFYSRQRDDDYSFHLLWPLYNCKHDGDTQGWRLWPLYADWRLGGGDYYGWYAWPLGWRWGDSDSRSRLLVPLFYQESAPRSSTFLTLLGGRHRDPGEAWSYLVPLWVSRTETDGAEAWYSLLGGRRREPDGDGFWYATPALTWRRHSGSRSDLWAGGPLFHAGRDADSASSHLFPLYYYSHTRNESLQLSLPWSRLRSPEKSWNLVPPLWFDHEDAAGDFTVTPLYIRGRDKRTGETWSSVPPVYYHRNAETGDTFLSPLYNVWPDASGGRSTLVPPALTYYHRGPDRTDLWAAAGLGHWSWGEKPGSSHLLPLYYRDGSSGTLLSPLYCSWLNDTGRTRTSLIPPLLSWVEKEPGNTSLYALLGLGKFNWGPEREDSYLFPFYYRDPANKSFLSLPYARWTDGDRTGTAIPVLLSWFSRSRSERELRLLLGLYGRSWSTEPDVPSSGWLFPIYAAGKDYFLTLPAGRWKEGGTAFTYFPTPLAGWRTGATRGSWMLPLYWYRRDVASGERVLWYLPWGGYHAAGRRSESGLFPIYGYECEGPGAPSADAAEWQQSRGRSWHVLYIAGYSNKHIPLWQYNPTTRSNSCEGAYWKASNRLFPLWRYERTLAVHTRRLEKEFSLLFFLQDYWRKADLGEGGKDDYTRTRILWRFLHYERDHDVVSLDLFPAITYDRDGAEKRKVSFLWRGFRYERKEGQKAVDLLFIPVWRTAWME